MAIEIRETIVTPSDDGDVVQLHISDVEREDVDAAIRLVLTAKVPSFDHPLLAQLQREAMKVAQDALTGLLHDMAQQIKNARHDLNPRPKG